MFGYEYSSSIWKSMLLNNARIFFALIISVILILYFLNILPSFKITRLPQLFSGDSIGREKVYTNIKTYSSMPIEKLLEIERQL